MENKEVLLILGNGFDLNLGLKTSYNHFFENVKLPENKLFEELHLKNKNSWIDIEQELEECSNKGLKCVVDRDINEHKSSIKLHRLIQEEYNQLKGELKEYLKTQTIDKISKTYSHTSAFSLLFKLCDREEIDITALNFNYTNTLNDFFSILFNEYFPASMMNRKFKKSIEFIHGKLNTDIVFGIDDKAVINKEHVYLYKSFDRNKTAKNINLLLELHNEIIFFGYSLGETDKSYFEDFFNKRCLFNETSKEEQIKITFYYYGEEDYKNIYYRLVKLTNYNVSKLIQYNNIEFIDASK